MVDAKKKANRQQPAKMRVLVVDDEANVLMTYRLILEQQGFSVVASATSVEAKAAIVENDFRLVLCDFSLEQQHTGFEVIDAARKKNPDVAACILTGYATVETAEQAKRSNIGILFKPIDIQEFISTINSLLKEDNDESAKTGTE